MQSAAHACWLMNAGVWTCWWRRGAFRKPPSSRAPTCPPASPRCARANPSISDNTQPMHAPASFTPMEHAGNLQPDPMSLVMSTSTRRNTGGICIFQAALKWPEVDTWQTSNRLNYQWLVSNTVAASSLVLQLQSSSNSCFWCCLGPSHLILLISGTRAHALCWHLVHTLERTAASSTVCYRRWWACGARICARSTPRRQRAWRTPPSTPTSSPTWTPLCRPRRCRYSLHVMCVRASASALHLTIEEALQIFR